MGTVRYLFLDKCLTGFTVSYKVKVTIKMIHLHKDDSSFNFCVKVGLLQLEHRAGFHFLNLDMDKKNNAENPSRVDFDF